MVNITVPPTDGATITGGDPSRFRAVAYNPAVGTYDGAGIQKVEFEIRDASNTLIHSRTENWAAFCVFDGNMTCNPAPANILNAPPGVYTLRARAQSGGVFTDWMTRTYVIGGSATATNTPTSTPTPTATPSTGSGLTGAYYNNADLTNLVLTRVDPTVNFNWGSGSPDAAIGADTFSVRWTGQVEALYSETYTFYTDSNNGVRLWVNNQLLIDFWQNHSGENSGTIGLAAGQRYPMVLEYYENVADAWVSLSWSSASQPKQIIPQGRLYPS